MATTARGGRKIYFCGSIRGGRDDVQIYRQIVKQLKQYGQVFTEHVADPSLVDSEEERAKGDKYIHDRDLNWLQQSEAVVAEVTQPSLGVGYELGRSVEMKKRVLCLFRPDSGKRLSAMIRGAEDNNLFTVKDYKLDDVPEILKKFFEEQKTTQK